MEVILDDEFDLWGPQESPRGPIKTPNRPPIHNDSELWNIVLQKPGDAEQKSS